MAYIHKLLIPEEAGAVLLAWLADLHLKPGDVVPPSRMMVQWQGTPYSFAEMGAGIDYLMAQGYLERRENCLDALYLTEIGVQALCSPLYRPAGSRIAS
jgi:hypothetical protein